MFEDADREGRPLVAVISAAAAQRFWPDRNPVGERFSIDEPEITIVGVVGDVRSASLDSAAAAHGLRPVPPGSVAVHDLRAADGGGAVDAGRAVRDAIWRVDKDQPVGAVLTMDSSCRTR